MKTKHTEKQALKHAIPRAKLGLIIFLLAMMVASVNAQSQRMSIAVTDTTLETVIKSIRKQTDVNIIYNNEEVNKYKKVTVNVQNGTVEDVLKQALAKTRLTYVTENRTFIIKKIKSEETIQPLKNLPTQTVRGTIIDRESKIPLPGASVVVVDSDPLIGTATDFNGNFTITNVPIGRHDFKVSFVGYQDAVLTQILVGTATELVLTIEISESITALDEITVTNVKGEPINEMSTISAKSFSVEETKRYAASIGDPARMAQSFAGVSTGDDASNEIIIRGNSPNWLLWRLEGVEIPSPNHFSEEGGSAGAVSILSTNMLDVSDFYSGAFSAEFGNALSGVFDIRLRNGNNQEHEFSAQLGVLGLELAAEGPFKKGYKGSFLINYRYSTFSILNNLNIEVSENALPSYQDLAFKMNLPTKKVGTFSIWGIGGESTSDEEYLPDTTSGEAYKFGYSDYTTTGMYAAGITHTIFTDKRSFLKTVISSSASQSSQTFDQMDSLGNLNGDFFDDLQSSAIRFNSFYNRKISNRLTIRGGVILSHLRYKYFTQAKDSLDNWVTRINSSGNTNQYQFYAQGKYKFSDRLVLTAGLQYMYFALNQDNSIEPRIGLTYELPYQQKISAGFGIHGKPEQLSTYFIEVTDANGNTYLPNKNLGLTNSIHYVLSYEKRFENIMAKAEAYYQYMPNLPVANNPNKLWSPIFGGASANDTLANIGKGRNYGLEITVQKFFSNSFYFMVTSSLFQSEYQAADGIWRSTKYNINYINNLVGGKEFKWGENKMVSTNLRIVWTGGKRLIPIDLEASITEGKGVYQEDNIWVTRGKDYFRIDIGAKLHFFKPKVEHIISLDIQNVTNRANQWTEIYNPDTEQIQQYPMAGLIPIASYKIKF
jgi:hypothetical protein